METEPKLDGGAPPAPPHRRGVNKRVSVEELPNIDKLCEMYGIDPPNFTPEPTDTTVSGVDPEGLAAALHERGDSQAARCAIEMARDQGDYTADTYKLDLEKSKDPYDGEEGFPGTRIYDGRIEVEKSGKYSPFTWRGMWSDPGLGEEWFASEVDIRRPISSIKEILVGADYEVKMPDKVNRSDRSKMQDWVRYLNKRILHVNAQPNGIKEFIGDTCETIGWAGFSVSEAVWARDPSKEVWYPTKLGYREPSTVDRWVTDSKQDLSFVDFRVGGDDSTTYTLSARGTRPYDWQVMLSNIAARGANFEGIAPARTAAHWVKFKRLLGQIAAATAQKYGVPTTYVYLEPQFFKMMIESFQSDPSQVNVEEVVDKLDHKHAVEAAIVGLPDGLQARVEAPQAQMPNLEKLLRYCDEQIEKVFSNEGVLLGNNSVGSYAMAEVADDRFVRSAPAWFRRVIKPVNKIIWLMTRQQFGRDLVGWPEVRMKMNVAQDNSKKVSDIARLFPNLPITTWPSASARVKVAELLDMDKDAFDSNKPEDEPGVFGAGFGVGGGGGMGRPPKEEGEGVEESLSAEKKTVTCHGRIKAIDLVESGDWILLADMDAERLRKKTEDEQRRLREALDKITNQQTRRFRESSAGVEDPARLREIRDNLEEEFIPKFEEAFRGASKELFREGAMELADSMGAKKVAPTFGLPAPDPRVQRQMDGQIRALAEEVSRRNVGIGYRERLQQLATAGDTGGRTGVPSSSINGPIIKGTASRVVGVSMNGGRDALLTEAKRRFEGQTGEELKPKAVRSSMLDQDTCSQCERLDFEKGGPTFVHGSANYYAHLPPAGICLGRDRCRCAMIVESSPEIRAGVRASVEHIPVDELLG